MAKAKLELSAVELVALVGSVKPAALKVARAAIAEESNQTVDFKVRINGTVNRLPGKPGVTTTVSIESSPDLLSMDNVCEVLRLLKVTPDRLATVLRGVDWWVALAPLERRDELLATFKAVSDEQTKTSKVKHSRPAEAGAIYSETTAERL